MKWIWITIGALVGITGPAAAATNTADVIVYGSTPSGFCAAIAAAREGVSVILVEPTPHIGGMNTGGLSFSDSNQTYRDTVMGLFHEWHLRIQQDYTNRGVSLPYDVNVKDQTPWSYEPHVAMRVTTQMLAEAGVPVFTGRVLSAVNKSGVRISSLVTSSDTFVGRTFVDATYEGDLMAVAGVSWTIGREGTADFGESYAGKQYPKAQMNINGFDTMTNALPLTTTTNAGPVTAGDTNVMTYSFRLSLTTVATNRVPMPAPAAYDSNRFEVVRRYVQTHGSGSVGFDRYAVPNGKRDGNNSIGRQFSIGFIGGGNGWSQADEAGRAAIFEAHKQYTLEFIHFLSNDPVFTPAERANIAQWGLSSNEFQLTGNWPPQLYVREGRRMQGVYVLSQSDIIDDPVKPDPIVVSSFPIDSHDVQRIALPGGGVINEGTIFPVRQNGRGYPYHVPYRSILPLPAECDNLLVPVALSCTHVGISSIRVEPTWMILGQSAGIAAALAANQDVAVQELPYPNLKTRLLAQGQVLDLPPGFGPVTPLSGIVLDNPDAQLTGVWSTSTLFTPFVGDEYLFAGTAGMTNDGSATATFRFTAPKPGTYQFNVSYTPDPTRATNVPITIASGPYTTNFIVDQTVPRTTGVMQTIGLVMLVDTSETVITLAAATGTVGFVILDAIQLILQVPSNTVCLFDPVVSNVTDTAADAGVMLAGTSAVVTLYWKPGTNAPEQHTGWEGTNVLPTLTNAPGLIQRTLTNLQPDTVYSYIFFGSNSIFSTSDWSSAASFTTAFSGAQTPVFTNVVATNTTITLGWLDNASNETAYILLRSTSSNSNYTIRAVLPPNTISYVDSVLPLSNTFYYRLAATNAVNGSVTDFAAAQTNAVVTPSMSSTCFQEGVSPTAAYTHDAVYIRSGDNIPANADSNFNNDVDQEIIVGITVSPDVLRGLLEFDVSSISMSGLVDSVSLILRTETAKTGMGPPITVNVYEYDFDIDEAVSTWNDPDGNGDNATGNPAPGGALGMLLTSATFDPTTTGADIFFTNTPAFSAAVSNAFAGDGFLRLMLARDDETLTGSHSFARFNDETVTPMDGRPKLVVGVNVGSFVDLALTKSVHPTNLTSGATNLAYTIAVNNIGNTAAVSVVVTDALPIHVQFISSTPLAVQTNGDQYVFNLGTIPAGSGTSIQITAVFTSGVTGITVTNWASVNIPAQEITAANNSDIALTTVSPGCSTNDTDGDGMSECEELIAGTDPMDPNSFLWVQIMRTGTQTVQNLVFPTETGRIYRIESNTNLYSNVWNIISSNLPGIGGNLVQPDTTSAERVYYRIGVR